MSMLSLGPSSRRPSPAWTPRGSGAGRGVVLGAHLGPVAHPPHAGSRRRHARTAATTAAHHHAVTPRSRAAVPDARTDGLLDCSAQLPRCRRGRDGEADGGRRPQPGHDPTEDAARHQQDSPGGEQDQPERSRERRGGRIEGRRHRAGRDRRRGAAPNHGFEADTAASAGGGQPEQHDRAERARRGLRGSAIDAVHEVGVEAGVVAGVARGPDLVDHEEEGVAVAVEADLPDPLDVAGRVALDPVLAS